MPTDQSRDTRTSSTRRTTAFTVASFAGVMLLMTAAFSILQGIAAILEDDLYLAGVDYVYALDVSAWGWIHLVIGIVGVVVALGILGNQAWGQLAGIALASLSTLTSFAFLPYYPLWSLVVIAFDVFVIWALCVQMTTDGTR